MATLAVTLVCFAVSEEAKFFLPTAKTQPRLQVLITGMGRRNAERAIRGLLQQQRPDLVVSSGFAGGLKPDLVPGTIVYAVDPALNLANSLLARGAYPAKFVCSGRVAATAVEKGALRKSTGADAVDMESEVISSVCRERNIPSATIRVILDAAHEDLPLDFNQLMTVDQQLNWGKITLALLRSPKKVAALLRLRKRSDAAAAQLGDVLLKVLGSKNS
jgi:adenosylhomocysteine nucleosidase